ncbi:MAG: hypothetical protein IJL37_09400 [Bacteroidaceae bacterium]|nr:hypothetical protein [Bacteroidaceae bacterium]
MFKIGVITFLFGLLVGLLEKPMTWVWEKIFNVKIGKGEMPWKLALVICLSCYCLSWALCWDWLTEDRPSKEAREILRKFSEEHEKELKQMTEWDSAYYDYYYKNKYDKE